MNTKKKKIRINLREVLKNTGALNHSFLNKSIVKPKTKKNTNKQKKTIGTLHAEYINTPMCVTMTVNFDLFCFFVVYYKVYFNNKRNGNENGKIKKIL